MCVCVCVRACVCVCVFLNVWLRWMGDGRLFLTGFVTPVCAVTSGDPESIVFMSWLVSAVPPDDKKRCDSHRLGALGVERVSLSKLVEHVDCVDCYEDRI